MAEHLFRGVQIPPEVACFPLEKDMGVVVLCCIVLPTCCTLLIMITIMYMYV